MEKIRFWRTRSAGWLAILLLAGCASQPVELLTKSALVPAGVDFSGQWTLRQDPDSIVRDKGDPEPGIRMPPDGKSRGQVRRRPSRRSSESAVRVFLEMGSALKITQTEHGLFISFDRSIVEEFTFGENRIVSVGPIEARRVSGWENDIFVVETLDEDGARLTESWRLDSGALVRDIAIVKGDDERFFARQRFDRS